MRLAVLLLAFSLAPLILIAAACDGLRLYRAAAIAMLTMLACVVAIVVLVVIDAYRRGLLI